MRARNIKPGLFTNEILGTAPEVNTLLFAGLWCIADRDGRLEDRPARIHSQILPYRPTAKVEQILAWLHSEGFISRYTVDGRRYIQIANWKKHQSPHHRENGSVIPAPVPGKPGAAPGNSGAMPCLGKASAESDNNQENNTVSSIDADIITEVKDQQQDTKSPGNSGAMPCLGAHASSKQVASCPTDSGFSDSGFSDSGFTSTDRQAQETQIAAVPIVITPNGRPVPRSNLPCDNVEIAPQATKLSREYMEAIRPTQSSGGGIPAIISVMNTGLSADDLRGVIRRYAEHCERAEVNPKYRPGPSKFFGEGSYAQFLADPSPPAPKPIRSCSLPRTEPKSDEERARVSEIFKERIGRHNGQGIAN